MDPYLEHPEIFPDLHDSFITYLREVLQANLPAPYFAALGRRIWIEFSRRSVGPNAQVRRANAPSSSRIETVSATAVANPPSTRALAVKVSHDEFREPFLEIFARGDRGKRLVTSIEVLSLSNKTPGERARDLYKRKQEEVLSSQVHLVEIDLLRGGVHSTAVLLDAAIAACGTSDYHVSIHRFDQLDTFFVYPILLDERLPTISIPLLPGDADVPVDLQSVFNRCYDAGPYLREIAYGVDQVIPPLRTGQADWAAQFLQTRQT
jgi:hypothetical protein